MNLSLPAKQLRVPVLILFGALILGVGLLIWGLSIHADSTSRLTKEIRQETEAARAAHEAPGELAQFRGNAGIYEQLRQGGFLGPERRAAWITALGQARATLELESLSWRLAPRTSSPLAPGLWSSAMDISASPVDASGLDSLLGLLRKTAPGRFTVERCVLTLSPEGLSGQAECRLNWWTWDHGPAHH